MSKPGVEGTRLQMAFSALTMETGVPAAVQSEVANQLRFTERRSCVALQTPRSGDEEGMPVGAAALRFSASPDLVVRVWKWEGL